MVEPSPPPKPAAQDAERAIVGQSAGIRRVRQLVQKVGASETTVLIQGETGTGKELVARAIHLASPRASRPLVTIDTGALPLSLAETEIFGHRRGSFTDAHRDKPGLIEQANSGTLFIDEVGDMSPDLQAKLLRFLQEGEVRRIGDTRPTRIDVRVIAATHRDLRERIADGSFRSDLYYRLNVVPIQVPSLVERLDDLPLLAEHFLARLRAQLGRPRLALHADVLGLLQRHNWPGNVRELENCLQSAAALCAGDTIQAADLPEGLRGTAMIDRVILGHLSLRDCEQAAAERAARELLTQTLARTGGDVRAAAQLLATPLQTVYYKLKRLGISPADFRRGS